MTLVSMKLNKMLLSIILSLSLNNIQTMNLEQFHMEPYERTISITPKSKALNVAKKTLYGIKYAYNHVGLIFSKNSLATAALVAWPVLKYNPEILTGLANLGTDIVIKINGAIAQGIVLGLIKNPKATAQLVALMTVQQTGVNLASGIGSAVTQFALNHIF